MVNETAKGMVDISGKDETHRIARASATISMGPEAYAKLINQGSPKGDVLETARVAGIMAAKKTPDWIPHCHPLMLSKVSMEFFCDKKQHCVVVSSEVVCLGRTGVEMEALTAVSAAVLTIYDMMKWAEKGMTITNVQLLHKSGGVRGDYHRK